MGQRILKISGELFPFLFSGEKRYRVIRDAIPDDAKVCNATLEFPSHCDRGNVSFLLESNQWETVPEGERIPDICPLLQAIHKDE